MQASEPLPFTIHINASAPLQPQSPPVSFTIVQTEATKSGSLTASADVFSTLGTDAQLPSTAANSNSLELCDGDTKESGHSAPRQLSAVDADVYPLNSASAVKEGAAHSSSRDRTDNVATASDAAYLNVQQQPSDRLLRPEHLQGPGAGDTDSNNDRSDIASVSDILQQQHLGQSFSHDQHHQQPQGVALGQSEISSNRPYLSAAVQPNLPSTHEKPQTDEASETHMTSSRVQSLDPAVPSQEQLDILISLFKQGKLSLPDELLAAGNSLDYVNVSTAGLWGNHLADLVDHCLEALGPVVATVGDQWRYLPHHLLPRCHVPEHVICFESTVQYVAHCYMCASCRHQKICMRPM